MKPSSILIRLLCVAILLIAFGTAVHRAKVRTITHDESTSFEWFVDQGVYHVLFFNFTNHVLQTLLSKLSVKIFGLSEFSLRVPALLGGAIYLIAIYFLCGTLFGDGILFLVSVALLALNPQMVEFMAVARGYSLGLGFLVVAMCVLARLAERGKFDRQSKEWRWGCAIASIAMALSLAGNMSMVTPVICLGLCFVLVAFGGPAFLLKPRNHALHDLARYLILPGLAVDFCILWPFLIQARMSQAKAPQGGASNAIRDAFNGSFLYKWTEDFFNVGAVPSAVGSWQHRVTDLGEYVLLPALFCFVLFGLLRAVRSSAVADQRQNAFLKIFSGAAICSVLFFVVLHVTVKIDYPYCRYCLYYVPLFTISGLLTLQAVPSSIPFSLLKGAGLIIAAVIIVDYALCLDTKVVRYVAYDAISLDLYQSIENDARSHDLKSVRVGGTWWYEPEINFYRVSRHADWMSPFDIKDPSNWYSTPNSLVPSDYDYFVYLPQSDPGLSGPRVRSIYHDPKTQVTIIAISR